MTSKHSVDFGLDPFAVDVVQDFHDVLQERYSIIRYSIFEYPISSIELTNLLIHQLCQAFIDQIQSFIQLLFRDYQRRDNKQNILEIENIHAIARSGNS